MSGAGPGGAGRRALPLQPAGGLQQVGALEVVWRRVPVRDDVLEVAVWGETGGAGQVVLAVHDTPGNALTWAGVAGLLDGVPPLVAPDLGRRDARAAPPVERQADDLVALVDALAVERVTLAGHGAGAVVAAAVAERLPGRAQRLVVVRGAAPPSGGELSGAFPTREEHRAAWQALTGLGSAWNRLAEAVVARDLVGEEPALRSAGAARGAARTSGDWSPPPGVPVTLVRDEPGGGGPGALPAGAQVVIAAGSGHWGLLLGLRGADAVARALLAPAR